jgi:predicted secreted protein
MFAMRSSLLRRLFSLVAGVLAALSWSMLAAPAAPAQSMAPAAPAWAPPQNVLQLSASAQIEVRQDMLRLTLSTSREGSEAAKVQQQLRQALDAALKAAGPTDPGQIEVHTGSFNVSPRYDYRSNGSGKISGWQGSAEMVIEGRDFARITAAAAQVETLTIRSVSFDLSREARERAQRQAQTQAIERFQAKAKEIAKAFGFADYRLREVTVGSQDSGFGRMQPMAMAAPAPAGASARPEPLPVEPGQTVVSETVSGSVQAR